MIKPGDKVTVLSSRHPDVMAGTSGIIDCLYEDGYGVAIDGAWAIAGSDRGACKHGIEICWYPKKEIRKEI